MEVMFRSPKFVDTKYAMKITIPEIAMIPAMTVIATNPWRLDAEHLVHVTDKDGEYPL